MKSFFYLYQKTIKNRVKKALKRPVAYLGVIFISLYILMIYQSFQVFILEGQFNSTDNLVTLLSIITFWLIPANLISYAKRKGLLFRPSEVHFVFQAPVSPKMVLMFAGVKSFAINILIGLVIAILGVAWFEAGILQAGMYFLFFVVFESILEASAIIFCYGNERLPARFFHGLVLAMYLFIAAVAGLAAFLMITKEPSFGLLKEFFALPAIQLIPVVGWNISATRLIFLGPDLVNLVGTSFFLCSTLGMFLAAWRMKCTGAYYEDAMKFADDYQARRAKQKKGIVSIPWLEKHKKLKQASVEYKGTYAKAIYFRQMLEYKKNPTFIFGWNTLLCLGIGLLVGAVSYFNDLGSEIGMAKVFIIPGVASYMVFVFSGYATKWSKELENAYTYLIPDTPLRKVWYATKIEHIRSLADGLLITLPGAITLGIGPVMAVLTIFLYVCLQANRLYYGMLADAIVGNILGNTGRTLVKMLLQMLALSIAIVPTVIAGIFVGVEMGFFLLILFMGVLTFAGAAIASVSFQRMEVQG
ncbi:MAG: hypothetical protein HFH38_04515 [Lachnospiraceae bacterium]|jgi:hypothetical protein|nr:hypothetical protein [Lachnospiraceae bacterium]